MYQIIYMVDLWGYVCTTDMFACVSVCFVWVTEWVRERERGNQYQEKRNVIILRLNRQYSKQCFIFIEKNSLESSKYSVSYTKYFYHISRLFNITFLICDITNSDSMLVKYWFETWNLVIKWGLIQISKNLIV